MFAGECRVAGGGEFGDADAVAGAEGIALDESSLLYFLG